MYSYHWRGTKEREDKDDARTRISWRLSTLAQFHIVGLRNEDYESKISSMYRKKTVEVVVVEKSTILSTKKKKQEKSKKEMLKTERLYKGRGEGSS